MKKEYYTVVIKNRIGPFGVRTPTDQAHEFTERFDTFQGAERVAREISEEDQIVEIWKITTEILTSKGSILSDEEYEKTKT